MAFTEGFAPSFCSYEFIALNENCYRQNQTISAFRGLKNFHETSRFLTCVGRQKVQDVVFIYVSAVFNNSSRKAVSLLKPCSTNFCQRGITEFKNTAFRKASQAPLIRLLEIVGKSGAFKCGLCMPAFPPPLFASGDLATRAHPTFWEEQEAAPRLVLD